MISHILVIGGIFNNAKNAIMTPIEFKTVLDLLQTGLFPLPKHWTFVGPINGGSFHFLQFEAGSPVSRQNMDNRVIVAIKEGSFYKITSR